MQILNIKTGVKEYQVTEGGALLRFNPADQNIYSRFVNSIEKIKNIENEASENAASVPESAEAMGAEALRIMAEADRKMKNVLNEVFGGDNNFDKILCGINLLAVNEDGKRIMEAFMEAITPILTYGAKTYADMEVAAAKLNREQRRSLNV